jgi:uncharacterized protein DUF222
VHDRDEQTDDELIEGIDACHARVCDAQRAMFEFIARGDRRELWRDWGARDMAHWLSMRYGISHWKALRWIAAAHALENLPRVSDAFASGRLSIDKVVELCRRHPRDRRKAPCLGRKGLVCGHPSQGGSCRLGIDRGDAGCRAIPLRVLVVV